MRCDSAVFTLIPRREAASFVDFPSAINCSTCRSRMVKGSAGLSDLERYASTTARDMILQNVSLYASSERFVDILFFFMLRKENCFRLWAGTAQFANSIYAVQRRHADVKDGDIRMVRFRQAYRFLPIGCFRNNLKFLTLQQ